MARARIAIKNDGKVGVFIEDGDFEGAKEKLAALFALLDMNGVTFDEVGQPEQHRHDAEHAHQHIYSSPHSH